MSTDYPIRVRYNTKVAESPGGEWHWRGSISTADRWFETLVKDVHIDVPARTVCDDLPGVGLKWQLARNDRLSITDDGIAAISPVRAGYV